jgi:hypothetical protein
VFDALVLDVMMPGENGFDYARAVRAQSDVPILMMTARAEPADRVTGLETGADDYLPKPFEPRELILRLANVLRRAPVSREAGPAAPDAVRFGPFLFRLDRGELRRGEEIIRITEREREILTILSARGGANVARDELAGGGTGPASGRSTSRSRGCGARSRPIRQTPPGSKPCGALATGSWWIEGGRRWRSRRRTCPWPGPPRRNLTRSPPGRGDDAPSSDASGAGSRR